MRPAASPTSPVEGYSNTLLAVRQVRDGCAVGARVDEEARVAGGVEDERHRGRVEGRTVPTDDEVGARGDGEVVLEADAEGAGAHGGAHGADGHAAPPFAAVGRAQG